MKTNRKIKQTGWQVFILMVILVLSFPRNVFAEEENFVLEENLELSENKSENLEVPIEESSDMTIEEEVVPVITKEEIWNEYSTNMEFSENKVILLGIGNENITVEEILNLISIENLKEEYHVLDIYMIDKEGNILENTSFITGTNHIVFLGKDFIKQYSIERMGDYTQDGIVNEEDIDSALDTNLNYPEEIPTEEISYVDSLVNHNTSEEPTENIESLETILEVVSEDLYIEEQIILEYSIEGLDKTGINAISGEINYDQDALEFVDIYISENKEVKGGIKDQYFIYLLDNYTGQQPLFFLTFKAKKTGIHQVTLQNIKLAINGVLLPHQGNTSIEFFVQAYGKGGDVSPEESAIPDSILNPDQEVTIAQTTSNTTSSNKVTTLPKTIITTTEIYLSNDNYIKELTIDGYSISFDKNQHHYQIDINKNIDQLDFHISLTNDNATYFIIGNENLQEGVNPIVITVQAEDGSTRDYIIEANKTISDKSSTEVEYNQENLNQLISMTILGILILSIIWCIYLFLKKED